MTIAYGIYNPCGKIELSIKLFGLLNILRAKLTIIHKLLQILSKEYPQELAHIFIDSLKSSILYLTR